MSCVFELSAQLEMTHWYFMDGAGMRFTENGPVGDTNANDSLNTGYMYPAAISACSYSDPKTGELAFYGSAVGIFNRKHRFMPNGMPDNPYIMGSAAEEGSIIIPRPEHDGQYYLFALRSATGLYSDGIMAGCFYSLVDMSLDGGLGDVVDTVKNVFLCDSTEEKLSATVHANGTDYWLMLRQSHSNCYLAFRITADGVDHTPVKSCGGLTSSIYQQMEGNLRFNHAADLMVHSRCCSDALEFFDFDNSTGVLTYKFMITPFLPFQGLEFSPDDSKLYMGGPTQFDLTVMTQSAIQSSMNYLGGSIWPAMLGLQLGPDGKIYGLSAHSNQEAKYMDCIHNPNAPGASCDYQDSVVYLLGRSGDRSVPQFITSSFKVAILADTACVGLPVDFRVNFAFIDSVFWRFGDPGSGTADTSTALRPSHTYGSPGTYTVTLIAKNGIRTDTAILELTVQEPPVINLGDDRYLCDTATAVFPLSAGSAPGTYLWNTGATDSVIFIHPDSLSHAGPNTYSVLMTNACGADSDTIALWLSSPLSLSLPPDTTTCLSPHTVVASLSGAGPQTTTQWTSNGELLATNTTSVGITRSALAQKVRLEAANTCGSVADSMLLSFHPLADGTLPDDSLHCSDLPIFLLNSQTPGITYLWSDSTGGAQLRVSQSGTYWLYSAGVCDTLVDSFTVRFIPIPHPNLGNDTLICPGEQVVLRDPALFHLNSDPPAAAPITFHWSTGQTDSAITVSDTGLYVLRLMLDVCTTTDSIFIGRRADCYPRCKPDIPNVVSPNGDGLNDVFRARMACNATGYRLMIFNRWGQPVHESRSAALGWDGTANGRPVREGVYFYLLEFIPENESERISYRGSFQVVR